MFLRSGVYLYLGLSISLIQTPYAIADNCDKYSQQIEKLEDLRRSGGSATQMNRWAKKLESLEDEKFNCVRNHPMIQTVSGASQNKSRTNANGDKRTENNNQPETSKQIALENIEKPKRKLSECIKPNHLIDKEVNDCLQGLQEPVWNQK